MEQRCEATSVEGFVCLVVQLISHGYYFYVRGDTRTERGLSPGEIDERIARKFEANLPKWTQARRRKLGRASVRYVRYGRDWFLFSTYGRHRFFDEHRAVCLGDKHQFEDIREVPIKFQGYSICLCRRGYLKKTPAEKAEHRIRVAARKRALAAGENFERVPRGRRHERWTASVRIEGTRYLALRDEFIGMAVHRSAAYLMMRFYNVPFEPFAPVRQQLATILREVNRARKHVGYDAVPFEAIRFKRKHISAFAPPAELAIAAAHTPVGDSSKAIAGPASQRPAVT